MTVQISYGARIHATRGPVLFHAIRISLTTQLHRLVNHLHDLVLCREGDGEERLGRGVGICDGGPGSHERLEAGVGVNHEADGVVGGGEAEGLGLVV